MKKSRRSKSPASSVKKYLATIGRKGGLTRGPTKSRKSETMRRAALMRWEKARAKAKRLEDSA